jgi:hypothetical protein
MHAVTHLLCIWCVNTVVPVLWAVVWLGWVELGWVGDTTHHIWLGYRYTSSWLPSCFKPAHFVRLSVISVSIYPPVSWRSAKLRIRFVTGWLFWRGIIPHSRFDMGSGMLHRYSYRSYLCYTSVVLARGLNRMLTDSPPGQTCVWDRTSFITVMGRGYLVYKASRWLSSMWIVLLLLHFASVWASIEYMRVMAT